MSKDTTKLQRQQMVNTMIDLGIRDEGVLEAMQKVPRHLFVPEKSLSDAYKNSSLSIGLQQTISQPYVVAHMTELLELRDTDKVLEIGTGSGYHASVVALLADEVFTMERIDLLRQEAERRLKDLGYSNVHFISGDGSLGFVEKAPYDAILVTAASPKVPRALLDQLAPGGRLVLPLGDRKSQLLQRIIRNSNIRGSNIRGSDNNIRSSYKKEFRVEEHTAVRFVPLIGEDAWS